MRYLTSALTGCALTLSSAIAAPPAIPGGSVEIERIVAIVNEDVIVESELDNRLRTIRARLREAGTPTPAEPVLRRQVLERLIVDRLQLQLAEHLGIRVDDESLNRALRQMAQRNGLHLAQFRDILERDGYDFPTFREEIRNEMLISQVQQRQVETRIRVTDREIDTYLATRTQQGNPENAYHLAHILVAVPEAASATDIATAERQANDVLDALRRGASFAGQAVAYSAGQQALQGGDLGWRKEPELPTVFAEVVPQMGVGEVRGPIRSPSGFHIIKLLETRGEERHIVRQTRARHILIRPSDIAGDAEVEARLEQLRERLSQGESFAELARAHSEDPSSAAKGGELGWVNPQDMVPEFQAVMDSLKPNQISQPFRTQFGWHIVQVLERRAHDDTEEVRRTRAKEQIRDRKAEEEMESWLRQLRDEAYVELRLED